MDKEDAVQRYNGILLSHKKNEIRPFAVTWMDLEIIILSEVNQKEKGRYHMTSFTCGIENMTPTNLSMQQKQTHRPKNRPVVAKRGEEVGGDGLGVWD